MSYDEIYTLLHNSELAKAFPAVREKARSVASWEVTEEVERQWDTYQRMMQFAMRGVRDPEAEAMRRGIVERLERLTVRLERIERMAQHREQRYVARRRELQSVPSLESAVEALRRVSTDIARLRGDDLARPSVREHNLGLLAAEREECVARLFGWLWTSEPLTAVEADMMSNMLFSNVIDRDDKAVMVSAMTLSLLEYADPAKLMMLLDCYIADDMRLSMRALVGFVIVMALRYEQQYAHCDALRQRMAVFKDDPEFASDLFMVFALLQGSSVTDKVTSHMRQDIMPALMKAMQKRKNPEAKPDMEQMTRNGENPEWVDDEHVSKRMYEMAELQLSGDDIYYSSFAHLKGNAFFREMAHWFYPFSTESQCVPEIQTLLDGRMGKVLRLMLNGSPFCDSDKYSLCFTFKSIGAMGEQMVEQQIASQLPDGESIDDMVSEVEKKQHSKRDIARHYIFDLYRFYYSYPYSAQFDNPFEHLKRQPLTPYDSAFVEITSNCAEETAQYADFMMRKEYYAVAQQLFSGLTYGDDELEATRHQKIGFCLQRMGNTFAACTAYSRANDAKRHSMWTLTHLIAVNEEMGIVDNVLKYCLQVLEIEPDNVKYILKYARALMACEAYQKAIPMLHKAHYIDEGNDDARALLALCLIAQGDYDKAMRHVMDLMPSATHGEKAKVLYALLMMKEGSISEAYATLTDISTDTRASEFFAQCLRLAKNNKLIDKTTLQLLLDALVLETK